MFRILQVKLDAKTIKGAEIISKHGRIWFRHHINKSKNKELILLSLDLDPTSPYHMWISRIPEDDDFIIWEEKCQPLLG